MDIPPLKKYQPIQTYFIAAPSYWPLVGCFGLFSLVLGVVQVLHKGALGPYLILAGFVLLVITLMGWFGLVIQESLRGLHSPQMDRTYRWGMFWFIVSEVALFGVFFLALFYTRLFSLTELGNTAGTFATHLLLSEGPATHHFLWPHFQAVWPLLQNPNPKLYPGPSSVIGAWGIPALNTFILLSSAATITWAHVELKKNRSRQVIIGLGITILLGVIFESLQVHEYHLAYTDLNLTLSSGIYGTTFFTLTGLHALHVCMGLIMLVIILIRCLKGHFLPQHHFAFAAVSWYWHFVDVVWLFLFVFVYWF